MFDLSLGGIKIPASHPSCEIHAHMLTVKHLQPIVPVLEAGHLSVLLILCLFVLYGCSLMCLGFLPFFSSSVAM